MCRTNTIKVLKTTVCYEWYPEYFRKKASVEAFLKNTWDIFLLHHKTVSRLNGSSPTVSYNKGHKGKQNLPVTLWH